MRRLIYLLTLVLVTACGASKNATQTLRAEADTLFVHQDYAAALEKYLQVAEQAGTDTLTNRQICVAANKVARHDVAVKYGVASQVSQADTVYLFALSQSLDSVGREHETVPLIESRRAQFDRHYGQSCVDCKLALYYNQTQDVKLKGVYPKLEVGSVRAQCFANYFRMVRDSLSESSNMKLCRAALKDNAEQETALFYIAKTLYDQGEEQYKSAMDDYNKKKNATTYAYLRRDLKRASATLVESKENFERLRRIDSENKTYIKYLININLRLEQKDKARELEKLL